MPFGQQSGPPATARQVQELLSLLQDAGHVDFRDARGPMGFTQRQANGKFTRSEAEAFVEQLQREAEEAEAGTGGNDEGTAPAVAPRADRPSSAERALRGVSDEQLAAELQRRGWVVMEP
jgi:hypothetical protein